MAMTRAPNSAGGRFVARAVLAVSTALLGCGGAERTRTAEERGETLFQSAVASDAPGNVFACATCHGTTARRSFDTGASLIGAPNRPSFWGGAEVDYLRALNQCRRGFMGASQDYASTDRDALDLTAYLLSAGGAVSPQPFSVVTTVANVANGDATRGESVMVAACSRCHGDADGRGRLSARISSLRADFQRAHAAYTPAERRLIFIEKVRHGSFLGYGGDMPPYSLEAMGDTDLSDLLTYLGL